MATPDATHDTHNQKEKEPQGRDRTIEIPYGRTKNKKEKRKKRTEGRHGLVLIVITAAHHGLRTPFVIDWNHGTQTTATEDGKNKEKHVAVSAGGQSELRT